MVKKLKLLATMVFAMMFCSLFSSAFAMENPQFDGRVYFFWMNGNKLCHKFFENVQGKDGQGYYPINWIPIGDVCDNSDPENVCQYVLGNRGNWVLARDVEDNGQLRENITKEYIFGDETSDNEDERRGKQLDPCGARSGEHSFASNADQNFRAVIYDQDYEGINFDVSPESLRYFPGFLDPTFFSSALDITGTTEGTPAIFETYLLNDTIKFSNLPFSKSKFKSVKPLGVNPEAVTVEEIYENGEYRTFMVTFKSRFYDKVVFEIEDEAGNKYYVRIARVLLQAHDNFKPDMENMGKKPHIYAVLYHPGDAEQPDNPENTKPEDYDVIATLAHRDGTHKLPVSLVPGQNIEDEDLPIGENGANLISTVYPIDISEYGNNGEEIFKLSNLSGIYFTVLNKGSLNDDSGRYHGTFGGSGKGYFYSIDKRRFVYGEQNQLH